jgi:prevent-host-death family protein
MKRVSIKDLKATLSSTIAEAEAGATIIVTRHGEAVAIVAPASAAGVHHGSNVGRATLRPAIARNTGRLSWSVLDDDRGDR